MDWDNFFFVGALVRPKKPAYVAHHNMIGTIMEIREPTEVHLDYPYYVRYADKDGSTATTIFKKGELEFVTVRGGVHEMGFSPLP